DSAIVCAGVERIDCTNAADPVLEIGPKCLDVIAKRRDGAQTGDNNSAIVVETEVPVVPKTFDSDRRNGRQAGNRNKCDTQPENNGFGFYWPAHSLRNGWISSILRAKSA